MTISWTPFAILAFADLIAVCIVAFMASRNNPSW